jgi:hypothetical protein
MTSSQKKIKQFMQKYDTLGALLIETAIINYSEMVLKDGLSEWGDNSLISKDLWLAMAEEAKELMEGKRNVVS